MVKIYCVSMNFFRSLIFRGEISISSLPFLPLKPVTEISGDVLVALAVFIGRTRLIDNVVVNTDGANCESKKGAVKV